MQHCPQKITYCSLSETNQQFAKGRVFRRVKPDSRYVVGQNCALTGTDIFDHRKPAKHDQHLDRVQKKNLEVADNPETEFIC